MKYPLLRISVHASEPGMSDAAARFVAFLEKTVEDYNAALPGADLPGNEVAPVIVNTERGDDEFLENLALYRGDTGADTQMIDTRPHALKINIV